MHKIEIKSPRGTQFCDLYTGQFAKYKDHIVLRLHDRIISLTSPSGQWVISSTNDCEILPAGTQLLITIQ